MKKLKPLKKETKLHNPNLSQNDSNFQMWYKNNTIEGKNKIPYSDKLDYDYYSAYKNNDYTTEIDKQDNMPHFKDTYKKPNHETFSNESAYSGNGAKGYWVGEGENAKFKEYKKGSKEIKKYARGIQNANPNYDQRDQLRGDIEQKQQIGASIGSTVAEAVVPGSGAVLTNADMLSTKTFKDSNGEYKNNFSKSLDNTLNPLSKVKALSSGNLSDIADAGTFGLASTLGGEKIFGAGSNSKLRAEREKAERDFATLNYNKTLYNGTDDSIMLKKGNIAEKGMKLKGAKVIEIEGKKYPEIHTNSKFELKTLGKQPHYTGGTKVIAEEGDVVFPTQTDGKYFKKIAKAVATKDFKTLEKERQKLPEDSGDKMKKGSKSLKYQPTGIEDAPEKIINETMKGKPLKSYNTDDANQERLFDINNIMPNLAKTDNNFVDIKPKGLKTIPTSVNTTPVTSVSDLTTTTPTSNGRLQNLGKRGMSALSTAADLSPTLFNMIRGAEAPARLTPNYVTSDKLKYRDTSEPLRKAINQGYKESSSLASELSGGNVSNIRANKQTALNRRINGMNQINTAEAERMTNTQNANTQIVNQDKLYNLGKQDQKQLFDLQSDARKQDFTGKGLEGLSKYNQTKTQMKNQEANEAQYLEWLKESGYAPFMKKAKGVKKIK